MVVGDGSSRTRVPGPAAQEVILLDTNALLWLESGHRRARPLVTLRQPLYVSPMTMLELQVLHEAGRLEFGSGTVARFFDDDRWLLDDPPAVRWFEASLSIGWTRDTFDRLIVAHARMRGWRLATADALILENLRDSDVFEL